MTNPGSLTMGFAGVDPRQLAPSVETTQVGITISAVPSSASYNSRARSRPSPLEGIKITADISATPSRLLELQSCQDRYYRDSQVQRQRRRNRRPKRRAWENYGRAPMNEPHHAVAQPTTTRQHTAARASAVNQDSDSETPVGEYYDPDRRPDEFSNIIKNQDMSRGIEIDPRFHVHPEDHEQIFRISRRKRHAGSSKLTDREQLAGPCTIHNFEDDWGHIRSGHTLRDCRLLNKLADDLKK